MLDVYQPVDPSTYSKIYPDNPSPHVKRVAKLMNEWFNLFIDMRYIQAKDVHFAPHKYFTIDTAQAAKYGLTKDAVDLYQMMPYCDVEPLWNFGTDAGELVMHGGFLMWMRGVRAAWWRNVIDPLYCIDHLEEKDLSELEDEEAKELRATSWSHDNGPYMKPWYVTLSDCGNHGALMVYNTRQDRIWIIETMGGTGDPAFHERTESGLGYESSGEIEPCDDLSGQGMENDDESNSDEEEDNNDDDSADADEDGHDADDRINCNSLYNYPARPAVHLLEDFISRFRNLEWIPGGLYGPDPDAISKGESDFYSNYQALYRECGWPDNFNPLQFDRLRIVRGGLYDYGERTEGELAKLDGPDMLEAPYAPLQRVYALMSTAKGEKDIKIRKSNADHRLAHRIWEQSHQESWLKRDANGLSPENLDITRQENEAQLKIELDFRRQDLAEICARTGRYGSSAWAGVDEAEYANFRMRQRTIISARVAELAVLVLDVDDLSRHVRQWEEAKSAAREVPDQAWKALRAACARHEYYSECILGGALRTDDVRLALDADYSWEELGRQIVEVLAAKELERTGDEKRYWRAVDGRVEGLLKSSEVVAEPEAAAERA